MIGTVRFYLLNGSQLTGEYPVKSVNQDISSHLIHSVSNVKFTQDLNQSLDVPVFTGYETPNIVELEGVGYFWITGYRTRTNSANQIRYQLDFNAPLSLLTLGNTWTGQWKRKPSFTKHLKQNVTSDKMKITNRAYLPIGKLGNATISDITYDIYWVEITSTNAYKTDWTKETANDQLTRYGFFAAYAPGQDEAYRIRAYLEYKTSPRMTYPSLFDAINNPDQVIGIEASSIVNISISRRCPWRYVGTSLGDFTLAKLGTGGSVSQRFPNLVKSHPLFGGAYLGIYRLDLPLRPTADDAATSGYAEPSGVTDLYKDMTEFTVANGQLILTDECQNTIGTIDTALVDPHAQGWRLNISQRTVGDYTGIYTIVTVGGSQYVLNEGHLPWVGSTWETYRAYSLDSDRQAVANAKLIADEEQRIGLVNAAINAIGTGGLSGSNIGQGGGLAGGIIGAGIVGGASFGLDYLQSEMSKQLTYKRLDMDQALTEKRMKEASGTPYSMTYGLAYCDYSAYGGAHIMLAEPANLTNTQYTTFKGLYGCPAEGAGTETIAIGFWQGRLYSASDYYTIKGQSLQRVLNEGIRIVSIT